MNPAASSALYAFTLSFALAHTASAQTCAPHTPGGVVVVTGVSRGTSPRLAASSAGVAVAWTEYARYRGGETFNGASAIVFYARVFDGQSVAPRANAREFFRQSAPYEVSMGPVLLARGDGSLVTLHCLCVGGAARFGCSLADAASGASAGRIRPENRETSVCPAGPLSAAVIGSEVLAAAPFPDVEGIRMHGTAVGALQDVTLEGEVQTPAMAPLGTDRAVFVRRAGNAIEARAFDVRGNTHGRAVTLSAATSQVGAPFALGRGERALVAFSQRRGRAPWAVQLATWSPGSAPTRTSVNTGALAAMAPSLAPASGDCVVLSWTEGSGRTTVARAGRVCNGVLDAASVAQLSRPGVEAGDSEVASDGTHIYAAWQEIPSARGSRPELRVARLGCQ